MTIQEKFMERVFIMTEGSGCWLWIGAFGANKRPIMKWNGSSVIPARISLMLKTGRMPKDLCALHRCDNSACVCPGHLYWGTRSDNGRDMSERGRVVYDNGFIGRKGELADNHRFTEADVIEMRRLHWEQGESYADIGRQFRVNSGRVHNICNGVRWGHIKGGLPSPKQTAPVSSQSKLLFCIAALSGLRNALLRCAS